MLKRKIQKAMYNGSGKQMLYLLCACLCILALLTGISYAIYDDGTLVWQDVVALFLDPGVFGGDGEHDMFRLIVALIGVFSFSSLLVSLFTNIISAKVEAYKTGESRFAEKNHVLFIGADDNMTSMLKELEKDNIRDDVVILTTRPVADLRTKLEHELKGTGIRDRLYIYKGSNIVPEDVQACKPWKAKKIYVVGDPDMDGTTRHDSSNIRCVEILKECCSKSKRDIPCYVMLDDDTSVDVFRFVTQASSPCPLKVDFIPTSEYYAEQLLVYSDFLPAITKDVDRHSHIVILGMSNIAKAVAYVSANISHYPNFQLGKNRTAITFVSPGIRSAMESMVMSKKSLFELCHWEYVSESKIEHHAPSETMGDYMDIEWQFIDVEPESFFVNGLLDAWSNEQNQIASVIVAGENADENTRIALRLSRKKLHFRLATYMSSRTDLLDVSAATGQYGEIIVFGPAAQSRDALYLGRSERGKRVNFIYDQAYGPKSSLPDEAWYRLPEAHKFSSIYNADAIPLRMRSFGEDCKSRAAYEAEHRQWMTSVLLMGYSALPIAESAAARSNRETFKRLKAEYVHPDIAPFDSLSEDEQRKDAIIIEAQEEILK